LKKETRMIQALGILAIPFFLTACLSVQVNEGVHDPTPYFDRAHQEIRDIERSDPRREGRAHELCLLIHDGDSDELIRLKTPLWMVQAAMDIGAESAGHHHRSDYENRYEVDWRSLRNLGQFGPGLLVSVDDEQSKILIWLR